MCFFVYMDFGKGFPWFMYTLTGSVLFFILHYGFEFHISSVISTINKHKLYAHSLFLCVCIYMCVCSMCFQFVIHIQIFIDGLLIIFFTWVITGMTFPWWFFVALVKKRKKKHCSFCVHFFSPFFFFTTLF